VSVCTVSFSVGTWDLETDIINICIRNLLNVQKEFMFCRPSYALQNIRKKIENENPHVGKFALLVSNVMLLSNRTMLCGSVFT
jgi:hypothetical protein